MALWPERTPAGFRCALAVGALLGVCPDADYLLSRLRVLGWGWHHGFTHSVVFAIIVGATVSWGLGLRGWRGALACVLPALSHPLLDYVITESPGVALWWPVTDRRYKLGIDQLSYYHITKASNGALVFVTLCIAEVLLFGPILAFTVRVSRRRFHAQGVTQTASRPGADLGPRARCDRGQATRGAALSHHHHPTSTDDAFRADHVET